MLPLGTVSIVQTFAAQLRGKGDLPAAYRHAHHGLLLSLLSSAPFLAAIPFLDRAVSAIGVAPEVQAPMAAYLAVRVLSVPAMLGLEALGGWYGGLGNTRVALLGGLLTMTANLAGNALLILPRFGLPGYGVVGAAWASTIASWVGFVAVLGLFRRGIGHDLPRASFAFVPEELRRVLRFGLPSGLNYFVEFTAFVAFINVVVGHLGTPTLAAFNIVLQVNSVSFMPAIGVASAGAILCGEAIGRGDREAVPAIVQLTLRITTAWMLAMAAVYVLAPRAILSLFDGGGVASIAMLETGATMLALSALWQLFDAIAMTH
ncbi:MAG: MATE family efflux transporter, partial [Deltaproteobacteria bacterium]|nr:MATE family efflux transporter [Deltaproteobacteria bacterium]